MRKDDHRGQKGGRFKNTMRKAPSSLAGQPADEYVPSPVGLIAYESQALRAVKKNSRKKKSGTKGNTGEASNEGARSSNEDDEGQAKQERKPKDPDWIIVESRRPSRAGRIVKVKQRATMDKGYTSKPASKSFFTGTYLGEPSSRVNKKNHQLREQTELRGTDEKLIYVSKNNHGPKMQRR